MPLSYIGIHFPRGRGGGDQYTDTCSIREYLVGGSGPVLLQLSSFTSWKNSVPATSGGQSWNIEVSWE